MNPTAARRLALATFVAAVAAAAAPVVWAADRDGAAAPLSRAEVKAETIAAMHAGQTMPPGERAVPQAGFSSTKTRAERKAETLAARSRGELVSGGVATYRTYMSQQTAGKYSTKTRAERKAETMDAIAHKQMMRSGEAA